MPRKSTKSPKTAKVELKSRREKTPKVKNEPKHVAAVRELRDPYLEHLNGEQFNGGLVLPQGKYAVGRALGGSIAAGRRLLRDAA